MGGSIMAPRNHKDWLKQPKMDYISSECYNNYEIFQEEQKEIFSKVWIPMCHISEMRNKGDYRTTRIADKRVIAINIDGENVQAYYNTNDIDYRRPTGTITYGDFATTEEPLYCEVKHGGMVWVTLDPNPTMSVEQWTAGAFDCIESAIDTYEMEVFHYHKAVINTLSLIHISEPTRQP